jgi:DNA-binding protein HU-beta
MNKTEMIDAIAAKANLSKADAQRALDAFVSVTTEELRKKNEVMLIGFGTFKVSERAARTGRNPRTGETLKIAATSMPGFKAGKALKDEVNK